MGKNIEICRDEFLSLHGLHNNRGHLRNVQKMVVKGILHTDGRGKHTNRPGKYSDEDVENVCVFVCSNANPLHYYVL